MMVGVILDTHAVVEYLSLQALRRVSVIAPNLNVMVCDAVLMA